MRSLGLCITGNTNSKFEHSKDITTIRIPPHEPVSQRRGTWLQTDKA